MKKYIDRFNKRYTIESDGCWRWNEFYFPCGYGGMSYLGRSQFAHRVSYQLFKGPIPNGLIVRHLCHHYYCVNPEHLEIGTHKDNRQDDLDVGKDWFSGSKNVTAKLKEDDVKFIRSSNLSTKELHKIFPQITRSHIQKLKRTGWKHI